MFKSYIFKAIKYFSNVKYNIQYWRTATLGNESKKLEHTPGSTIRIIVSDIIGDVDAMLGVGCELYMAAVCVAGNERHNVIFITQSLQDGGILGGRCPEEVQFAAFCFRLN